MGNLLSIANLCCGTGSVPANVHRFFMSNKVLSWTPDSWVMGFYDILPSCPSPPVASHHGIIWNSKDPEAWKKKKANNPPLTCIYLRMHTPIYPYVYVYIVHMGASICICLEGGREGSRHITILWSLLRQGFQVLEGSCWHCQPSKKTINEN